MKRVEVLLDSESEQILDLLARLCGGGASSAVRRAVGQNFAIERVIDELERSHGDHIRAQISRAESDLDAGRGVACEEPKARTIS